MRWHQERALADERLDAASLELTGELSSVAPVDRDLGDVPLGLRARQARQVH